MTGIIDFYFACNDLLAYDVAICLNAWCFEPDGSFNVTKARALLQGYRRRRALSEAEIAALPVLARGSALRFLLTRLYDWLHQVEGAKVVPKDPREYLRKLRFHRGVAGPPPTGSRERRPRGRAAGRDPHRRRLQRQSRPRRLGCDPRLERQAPRARPAASR